MSKSTKGLTPEQAKKAIAKRLSVIQKGLETAKNSIEVIERLNEMSEILEAEINQWLLLVENSFDLPAKQFAGLKEMAIKHIADLTDISEKINAHRAKVLPEAMQLQEKMLKARIIDTPLIPIYK